MAETKKTTVKTTAAKSTTAKKPAAPKRPLQQVEPQNVWHRLKQKPSL